LQIDIARKVGVKYSIIEEISRQANSLCPGIAAVKKLSENSIENKELAMKLLNLVTTLLVISTVAVGRPTFAGTKDPLFVNLTAEEPHRANMAVQFSKSQFELGHPVTIFLNDKGVFLGSKDNAEKFREQQAVLIEIMKKGGTVIACPMCMKHYGVKESSLLDGIKIGAPEFTGSALFRENTKTLSW
jgi:predicted peroxiredoxin